MNWYCEICGRNYGSNPPEDLECVQCGNTLTTNELKKDGIRIFVKEGDKDA